MGWAVWGPPVAPFTLLGSERRLALRVVVDRSTVEVFGTGGRVVVSVRDFPAAHETAARLRNEGGAALVLQRAGLVDGLRLGVGLLEAGRW